MFASLASSALLLTSLWFVAVTQAFATETDFVPLFDGKSLDNWIDSENGYGVANGSIVSKPGNRGNLYTEGQYSDFALRLEFKLSPGANSGIGLRAPLEGDAAYVGMESQVLDNPHEKYENLKDYQYHGSIYGVAAARRGALKPAGEWNRQEIICQGNTVEITLNGQSILDVNLDEAAPDGNTIDGRSHPGLKRTKGHIGFLGHGDQVWFRNVRIKSLAANNSEPSHHQSPELNENEQAFATAMSGATLVGNFTIDGQPGDLKPERYEIGQVRKGKNNYWMIPTRIVYGGKDVTLPISLPVHWAGDTPVITVDNVGFPGLGSYSARVIIHDGYYSGYWKGAGHGGHLFGKIVKPEPAQAAEKQEDR